MVREAANYHWPEHLQKHVAHHAGIRHLKRAVHYNLIIHDDRLALFNKESVYKEPASSALCVHRRG